MDQGTDFYSFAMLLRARLMLCDSGRCVFRVRETGRRRDIAFLQTCRWNSRLGT